MKKEDVEKLKIIIIEAHDYIIKKYGGELGIRDDGGLYHASYRLLYCLHKIKDPFIIATQILADLAQNHHFIDGNKRISYEVSKHVLRIKGYDLVPTYKESLKFIISVAEKKVSKKQIKKWLKINSKCI